jgi:release factor glutamine methyltransferase
MEVLRCDRAFIISHSETELSATQLDRFHSYAARRAAGEPVQYITGHQEFFKLDFAVTPAVLIPRPETEILVEAVLEIARDAESLSFADIGTGSGCIAISLLKELPAARAVGVDISRAALEVASRNSHQHEVSDRLALVKSDGFAALDRARKFDLVVSNPPYIPDEEIASLQREVQREPLRALAGGADGLDVIRRLVRDAPDFLTAGGHFIFEIGFGQAPAIRELIDQNVWQLVEIRNDLANIPRTVVLRKR